MKKIFEGERHTSCPPGWDGRVGDNYFLHSALLAAAQHSDTPFYYVTHPEYICCEYKTKLNLFTFGGLKLELPMTVIGLPASLDMPGYSGSLAALAGDYKRRPGLCLMLNLLPGQPLPEGAATGHTLGTCVFHNRYASFEQYLGALRSGYRRRVNIALAKGAALSLRRITPQEYTANTHSLYLSVLRRSKFPLETLDAEFFRQICTGAVGGELYAFYRGGEQLAFFSVAEHGGRLHFLFGGLDYKFRDEYDLYYNILLAILRMGTERGCSSIDFGQTAEDAKCKLGCIVEPRYMAAFSGSGALNKLLGALSPLLQYRRKGQQYRVFKE